MLLTYVHAYVTEGGSIHVQATGPAFPTGYASGDIRVSDKAASEIRANQTRGSMRPGSSSVYAQLDIGDDAVAIGKTRVCTVAELVKALRGPCPPYNKTDAATVTAHVEKRLAEPTKTAVAKDSGELERLREENASLRTQVSDLQSKLDKVRRAL